MTDAKVGRALRAGLAAILSTPPATAVPDTEAARTAVAGRAPRQALAAIHIMDAYFTSKGALPLACSL